MSGCRVILFSWIPMTGDGVDAVDERTASTASAPCRVARMRSYATGLPPRWVWPTVREDVLDLARGDRVEVDVVSALGNDDDGLALALVTVLYRDARNQ
jgi:hypothetical protein